MTGSSPTSREAQSLRSVGVGDAAGEAAAVDGDGPGTGRPPGCRIRAEAIVTTVTMTTEITIACGGVGRGVGTFAAMGVMLAVRGCRHDVGRQRVDASRAEM
jgi:hypothetical protein